MFQHVTTSKVGFHGERCAWAAASCCVAPDAAAAAAAAVAAAGEPRIKRVRADAV